MIILTFFLSIPVCQAASLAMMPCIVFIRDICGMDMHVVFNHSETRKLIRLAIVIVRIN